jgi:hypothetical protein
MDQETRAIPEPTVLGNRRYACAGMDGGWTRPYRAGITTHPPPGTGAQMPFNTVRWSLYAQDAFVCTTLSPFHVGGLTHTFTGYRPSTAAVGVAISFGPALPSLGVRPRHLIVLTAQRDPWFYIGAG